MSEATLAILRKVGSRIVLIASLLFVLIFAQWLVFRCPLPFVASLWHVDIHGTTFNTRYRIADGLKLSGHLVGMTRPEVLALLGPPSPTDKWEDRGLVYVLEPAALDFDWLLVDFDSAGKVSKVEMMSD